MFTKEQTEAWWEGLCATESKLIQWLQKLYKTELGGYIEHLQFLAGAGFVPERTAKILLNIALDELKHAGWLEEVLAERGVGLGEPPVSTYWDTINAAVVSFEDYCAANYYGEALASARFETILSMDCTPLDVRVALMRILPDEKFHMVTLKKLAGPEALVRMLAVHEKALATFAKS